VVHYIINELGGAAQPSAVSPPRPSKGKACAKGLASASKHEAHTFHRIAKRVVRGARDSKRKGLSGGCYCCSVTG
jgi:hypothetical protein